MNFNNTSEFLALMEDIFVQEPEDREKFLRRLDLTEEEFQSIINGELEPDKLQLENIYNYAYNNNLYLNEILWQDRLDELRGFDVNVCSHGSRGNIEGDIKTDLVTASSDFGSGFYLGSR